MNPTSNLVETQELDARVGDGREVRLLWREGSTDVLVEINDSLRGARRCPRAGRDHLLVAPADETEKGRTRLGPRGRSAACRAWRRTEDGSQRPMALSRRGAFEPVRRLTSAASEADDSGLMPRARGHKLQGRHTCR